MTNANRGTSENKVVAVPNGSIKQAISGRAVDSIEETDDREHGSEEEKVEVGVYGDVVKIPSSTNLGTETAVIYSAGVSTTLVVDKF